MYTSPPVGPLFLRAWRWLLVRVAVFWWASKIARVRGLLGEDPYFPITQPVLMADPHSSWLPQSPWSQKGQELKQQSIQTPQFAVCFFGWFFLKQSLLCSPGWPETHCALKPLICNYLPSGSQVMGLQAGATVPGFHSFFYSLISQVPFSLDSASGCMFWMATTQGVVTRIWDSLRVVMCAGYRKLMFVCWKFITILSSNVLLFSLSPHEILQVKLC